eukprot:symbB.v1.2.031042.t1/scaffold3436.1/size58694/3
MQEIAALFEGSEAGRGSMCSHSGRNPSHGSSSDRHKDIHAATEFQEAGQCNSHRTGHGGCCSHQRCQRQQDISGYSKIASERERPSFRHSISRGIGYFRSGGGAMGTRPEQRDINIV